MDINLEKATQLVLSRAAHEYRETLVIHHVESTDQLPYDFNPESWELFMVDHVDFHTVPAEKLGEYRHVPGRGS